MKKLSVLSFLILLISINTYSQITTTEIDQLLEETLSRFHIAGAAVGIVKDGAVIHSRGYGTKSANTKEKVNELTQFAIASNTKAFTTTALAILVDQGKITWEDKVVNHIPEFKMYNDYVTQNFNITDLVTHRSGLGLGAGDLIFIPDSTDFTVQDLLTMFQHFEPVSAFRTKFDYDNLLYIVAGELIARVSGVSWEQYVSQNILKPLGMNHTYTSLDSITDRSNLSSAHVNDEGVVKRIAFLKEAINGAAGSIFSSTNDLCKWMLVHLNEGKYGNDLDQVLFTEPRQREMWRMHTTEVVSPNKPYNIHFAGYGLGWQLADIKGNLAAYHGGGNPGMVSQTILIPDLELGIVVLFNTADQELNSPVEFLALTILDSYLGLEDQNWLDKVFDSIRSDINLGDSVANAVWKTVESADDSHLIPTDFIGIYQDPWFGKVEVFQKGDQLWFKSYRSPKLNGPMRYYKATAFAIKWEYRDMNADALAIFSLDEEGKAQSIKMKGISPNIDFSFDFQDLDLQRVR